MSGPGRNWDGNAKLPVVGKDDSRPILKPPRNIDRRPLKLPPMKPIKRS